MYLFCFESSFKVSQSVNVLIYPYGSLFSFAAILFSFFPKRFSLTQVFFFRCRSFSFARSFFFCRDLFFCCELFLFAAIIFFSARTFLLPQGFFFCRDLFPFWRKHFYFVTSIFLLPRGFYFCHKLFSFAVALASHKEFKEFENLGSEELCT